MSFKCSAIFQGVLPPGILLDFMDIGARGDLPSPWKQLEKNFPERLRVTGFEPDPKEAASLAKKFPNRIYHATGLGAQSQLMPLYLNKAESTSSIFRPNRTVAKQFERKHSQNRVVKSVVDVEVSKLDDLDLDQLRSPFVKIDVQGAELEILKGGEKFFNSQAIGFSAETWTREVYEGQCHTKDIMAWASENDFDLFGLEESGRWRFDSPVTTKCKGVPVCVDLLYFKNIEAFLAQDPDIHKVINYALILDLWGFPGAALQMLKKLDVETNYALVERLITSSRRATKFGSPKLNDFIDKVLSKMGISPNFPPIHE